MARESKRIESLDWLRALAIVLVLVHHIGRGVLKGHLPRFLGESWTGVDLFFVLSGYLVTRSLAEWLDRAGSSATHSGVASKYAFRRFLRILPPAWFWAGIPWLAGLTFNESGAFGAPEDLWREFLGVISFVYNYFTVKTGLAEINYFWSLAVEEHFYLILPVFLLLVRSRSRRFLGLAALIGICGALKFWAVSRGESPSAIRFLSHFRVDALAIGSVLGLLDERIRNGNSIGRLWSKLRRGVPIIATLCIVYLWTAPTFLTTPQIGQFGLLSFSLVSAVLIVLALRHQPGVQNRLTSSISSIGQRSYSLYLVHLPVYHATREIRFRVLGMEAHEPWGSLHLAVMELAFCILLLWVVNEVSYRWIERPLILRGRAWFPGPIPKFREVTDSN